ncbi:MAG: stage V sporulation protein AC [Candidatus Heritagella sp.]|nr:stage V sporulation protein AC [Candidatus Heritagella sp.]
MMSHSVGPKEYSRMVEKASPPSPLLKDCLWAFFSGGAICCLGQLLSVFWMQTGFALIESRAMVSVTLIFFTAILTACHWFDDIAKHTGAGTLIPITGFANSMVSSAIEFKSEGYILGVGAKIFTIAGPVIMYGTVASVVYGIIYWITTLF